MRFAQAYLRFCDEAVHALDAHQRAVGNAVMGSIEVQAGKLRGTGAVLEGTFRVCGELSNGRRFSRDYGDLAGAIVDMSSRWAVRSIWHITSEGKKLVVARGW